MSKIKGEDVKEILNFDLDSLDYSKLIRYVL